MKRVAIIGGGISGLTVLHYLKQRFADTVEVTLFERESAVGGTVRTLTANGCRFETGPNGFMDNQPSTLQLVQELGLTDQLLEANPQAKHRYIQIAGQLLSLPSDPMSFIKTPLLSVQDKWALIRGIFKKNISTDQTIYDYASQRFSVNVAERLADPFITGVYAGNIKLLHMASAFPKLVAGNKKKKKGPKHKTRMRSFRNGMGQLIDVLYLRYKSNIKNNMELVSAEQTKADIIVLATPAYVASKLIKGLNPSLAVILEQIPYAPVAVIGLVFSQGAFKRQPDGFGYLVPSKEQKEILGVLIESNVYSERGTPDQVMIRVILGGRHHPEIMGEGQEQIVAKAIKEIDATYGLVSKPLNTFVKLWPKGIPQYELNYPVLRKAIAEELKKTPHLYLCANYLDGISFNDCIQNAKTMADSITL